jgi:PBP1b-binding outer membrane lipoprotein LpoB
MSKTIKSISIIFCLSFLMTGCSTLTAGYDSVSDTVAGWFKSDEAKK